MDESKNFKEVFNRLFSRNFFCGEKPVMSSSALDMSELSTYPVLSRTQVIEHSPSWTTPKKIQNII